MKVNDYVRTKNYGIAKITRIDPIELVAYTDNKDVVFGVDEQKCVEITGVNTPMKLVDRFYVPQDNVYILDYNSNLLDLIEIGDLVKIEYYVPKYHRRLTRLFEVEYKENDWIRFCNSHCDLSIFNYKWIDKGMRPVIKSIVSKEQFESMEHRIGK